MNMKLAEMFRSISLVSLMLAGLAFMTPALAQTAADDDDKGELRGLRLGMNANEMDLDGFGEFACGSNGGPPRALLEDWRDFKKCRPEPNGLYEVYVRFDDQTEYLGKALEDPTISTNKRGTTIAGHPIVLTTLFDSDGVLRMMRFVTDPRGDTMARRMAHLLRLIVINRYDPANWECEDIPPGPGETPVGGIFHHSKCIKNFPAKKIFVEGKFFRKPGQSDVDPNTREYTSGYFESSTRVEIYDPTLKIVR